MKIIFATQNQNKVAEIQKLMPEHIQLYSLKQINCQDDIAETEETLEGNASLKSKYIAEKYNLACFADDTGLEIEALNGEPGVKSARYADELDKNDNKNIDKVLGKLSGIVNRNAQFRTVISLIINDKEHLFEGIAQGKIATERQGKKGFGYDPIFIPEGEVISFAEMSMEDKNKISHRGKAVQKLVHFLSTYPQQ